MLEQQRRGRSILPDLGTREPPGFVLGTVVAAIALIPLVKPRLPGNSGPVDFFIALAVASVAVWAAGEGRSLRVPFALGVVVMMVAGSISGLAADRPGGTLLVVVQEIHLLLFCAAVVAVARTPKALATLQRAWVWAALAWALLVIVAMALGIQSLIDATESRGNRVHLFFQNPNITGNYFMISFFVAMSASWPRSRLVRVVVCSTLLTAMLFTGSNAAIGGVLGGVFVALAWWIWQRRGAAAAALFLAILLATGAVGAIAIREGAVFENASESENLFIRFSIGRAGRSADARQDLFASQIDLYHDSGVLGIGPFATRDLLGASGESGTRSSHSDYLATLVERGPLGVIGLVILAGSIGVTVARAAGRRLSPGFRAVAGTGAGAAAVAVATALAAITHEVLHYRHLWAVLGLIAAARWWGSEQRTEP